MRRNKSFLKNLCLKDLNNNITDSERKILAEWLSISEDNKNEYDEIRKIWEFTSPENLDFEINQDVDWKYINSSISNYDDMKKSKIDLLEKFIDSISKPRLRPAYIFISVILLIVSSVILYNIFKTEYVLEKISTENNQYREIILSDGSSVRLNNSSEIQFYKEFEDEKREILLKGEAYFSVINDGRTFIVLTENAATTVLGTEFNIWARGNETRILVKKGEVGFAEKTDSPNKIIIKEGEASRVLETSPPSKPLKVDTDFKLGWLEGKIVFDNTPLGEIVRELERNYDQIITLENPEIKGYKLTGSFDNEEIDTVLAKICLALNLNYTENSNGYVITK